ncbi:double-CXXCG motif protein [Myxococcus sp. K38C18041901]|uniref:SitI6 family double-CXXCG motif immunity protein n=1 Tax=Myxococcus guangdongensis TaxID=2906760 RepID=UPI0020A739BD|nr:double-CXXCG motif protein [Myxococcus guangdongensis]MCP3058731.1 double-CXXCG motif protein [Myxococcus guangdongensis]
MDRFYWLDEDQAAATRDGGHVDASHRWGLPGLLKCPTCEKGWAAAGHYYPGVDLTPLGEKEREFRKARQEPFDELARLRALVLPLAPPGAPLPPGTTFGPLVGRCSGQLPDFTWVVDELLLHRRVLDGLQAGGVRGLDAFPTELRSRQKSPPDVLEMQLAHRGQLHPDCIPDEVSPPCTTCGRFGLKRPDEPILDASSLPSDLDLFRVGNFATMVICTERFLDAVSRVGGDGLSWRELPVRARTTAT